MVELRVVSGRSAGQRTAILQFPFVIGRSSKAGLSLSDPGVWEQHASITQSDDGSFFIRPERGAVLNFEGAGITERRLRNGDCFDCGAAKVRFWISSATPRSLIRREATVWAVIASVVLLEIWLIVSFL